MVVLASASSVMSQDFRGGSYYCVTEFSGGLNFDHETKRWKAARFRPEHKFVLKVSVTGKRLVDDIFDKSKKNAAFDLDVTITDAGTSFARKCMAIHPDPVSGGVTAYSMDYIFCEASLAYYKFNLTKGRFLSSYLQGYVDGSNNNDDTPSVSGGTCTKI